MSVRRNHFGAAKKPFLASDAVTPKRLPVRVVTLIKQRGSVMWTVLSLIYRQYCWARLMEMRKSHLSTAH